MAGRILAVTVPKWGMAMEEGKVTGWLAAEGDEIAAGQELLELETSKIANVVEAMEAGTLRRIVGRPDETLAVGALLGVLTLGEVSDGEIDAFIAGFVAPLDLAVAAAAEPTMIESAGRRARYLRTGPTAGDKLPILLLHGFLGDLDSWMFLRERLPADRAIFALDLPGHGGSEKAVGAGDIASLCAAVRGFMDAVGIARAHLVGHSMGGAVALALAASTAGRVASVTTIAGAGYGQQVSREFVRIMLDGKRGRDLKPAAEMLFADPGLATRELVENLAKFKRLDGVEHGLATLAAATLFAPATDRLAADLPRQTPALAIIGERDRVIPPPGADGVPAHFLVVRLPVGHMAHLEAAAEVAAAIRGFLDGKP